MNSRGGGGEFCECDVGCVIGGGGSLLSMHVGTSPSTCVYTPRPPPLELVVVIVRCCGLVVFVAVVVEGCSTPYCLY